MLLFKISEMVSDTADIKEEKNFRNINRYGQQQYKKDCSIMGAFCKFVSDIFFKVSHLHANKSTICPHLLKDFSQ